MNQSTTVALAGLAVVVLTAGALPAGVLAGHGSENTDYTVATSEPAPGAQDVSYTHRVELTDNLDNGKSGFKNVSKVTFSSHAGDIAPCEGQVPGDLDAAYNLSVTESTDSGTAQKEFSYESVSFSSNSATFNIDDSSSLDYKVGEVLRLDLDTCVTNPESEGWYQVDVTVRGSAFSSGESIQLSTTSHYYPICENCDNESAARAELGPPPSESTPTPTATPTPTQTPSPTATPTPPDQDEPTQTATEPPDDDETATEPPDSDESTPTATATATDGADQETVLGVDPMVVVGVVAAVSIGIAVFGATRL